MTPRHLAMSAAIGGVIAAAIGGAVAGVAPRARAHPLSLGVLVLREEAGGVIDVSYRFSGTEARATGAEPELPTRCRAIGVATEAALPEGGVLRRRRVDCGTEGLAGATIAVRGMEGTGVEILVEVERASGEIVRALLDDGTRTMEIPREPDGGSVLREHVLLGVEHIAGGIDHLLFVLGLMLVVRSTERRPLRGLVATITAFTVGHSVTLAIAVTGALELRAAPVEACIAASILWVALEAAHAQTQDDGLGRRPWVVAGAFGLLHGLGFAGALREAGLPRGAVAEALLGFNVGVELGQLAFVLVCLALFALLARAGVSEPRSRGAAALAIGGAAAYFLMDRLGSLGGSA